MFLETWPVRAVALCVSLLASQSLRAQSDAETNAAHLITEIDRQILSLTSAQPADPEQDSVQLRKLYLCLVGLPPSLDEIADYVADNSEDRYQRAVDRLLDRPEFVEHWAEKLDVMLMERRANTHVPQDIWTAWLREQLAANRPLHELMADLLVADGAPANRAPGRFLIDRAGDPLLITNDISRIYFGRDIQCAQCHNHPSIDSYLQSDYQGLLGFFNGLSLIEVADGDKKVQVLSEKSAAEAPFESVFHRGTMHRVLPHLYNGEEFQFSWTVPGEDYLPAEGNMPAKPVHSRRTKLADAIRSGNLDAFNINLANRLWSSVLGRGIVEPVDLIHADNPPIDELLLHLVADKLAEYQFDLKRFLRTLVQTAAFRRGEFPATTTPSASPAWLAEPDTPSIQLRLTEAQQALDSLRQQRDAAQDAFDRALEQGASAGAQRLAALAAVDTARAAYSTAIDSRNKLQVEQQKADEALTGAQEKITKLRIATDSVQAAVAAVGQDAELTSAAELIKSRLEAATAALEPLQKAQQEKASATAAAVQAATEAKQALVTAQTSATELDNQFRTVDTETREARAELNGITANIARQEAVVNLFESMSGWQDLQAQESALAQAVGENQTAQEQIRSTLQTIAVNHESAQAKLPELIALADSMQGQLSSKQQQLNTVADQLQDLATAQDLLQKTAAFVESAESLDETVKQLANSSRRLEGERQAIEQELLEISAIAEQRQLAVDTHKQSLAELASQITQTQGQLNEAQVRGDELQKQQHSVHENQATMRSKTDQLLSNRFLASQLRAMSPEQIGWSFLATTDVYQNYVSKHLAELEKATPASAEQLQDPHYLAGRQRDAVRRARAELQGNINQFVTLYGAGAGQPQSDFFATPDQALYASNGGAIFQWSAPSGNNVTARMIAADSPTDAAKILYRGVLSRKPSAEEAAAVQQYLEQIPEQKPRLAQELVWSLLVGAEFRFIP